MVWPYRIREVNSDKHYYFLKELDETSIQKPIIANRLKRFQGRVLELSSQPIEQEFEEDDGGDSEEDERRSGGVNDDDRVCNSPQKRSNSPQIFPNAHGEEVGRIVDADVIPHNRRRVVIPSKTAPDQPR